jgi:hypothetical protein
LYRWGDALAWAESRLSVLRSSTSEAGATQSGVGLLTLSSDPHRSGSLHSRASAYWEGEFDALRRLLPQSKETAIKIAEAVLFRLYGEDAIKGQRPYVVKEDDYIWWISGTLPKDTFGQVFNIGISRHTAAILRLTVGEDKIAGGK